MTDHAAATAALLDTTLRDSTRVRVRPVDPTDRDRFAEGFGRLSPRSRYLRFHAAVEELSERQLDYLTRVDQVDHVAWVAIDLDEPERPGIGVARFVRLNDEPEVAEAAVTVLDDYQGRGLGTLLLRVLADAARARGITTFRSYVLGENAAMLALLSALGPTHRRKWQGVHEVDVDLASDDHPLPAPMAARIVRAVRGNDLPAMHTTAPPVWVSEDTDDSGGAARHTWREWLDKLLIRRPDAGDADDRS